MRVFDFSYLSKLQIFQTSSVSTSTVSTPTASRRLFMAIVALMLASASYGGVEVRVVTTDHSGDSEQKSEGVMWLDDGNLAMDLGLGPESQKGKNTTLFQAETNSFVVVDHGDKSYSVMDEEVIGIMAEEMENAMMLLDQKMGNLPPEQRKILRDSLVKGEMESRIENQVTSTGEVATRAGYSTRKFVVHRGEQLVREIWVADWKQIPESEDVKAGLQGLEDFFQRLQKIFASVSADSLGGAKPFEMGGSPFQDLAKMNGFPMVTRNFEGGKLTTETSVESIKKTSLPSATFETPKDYRQRKMNGGR